MAVDTAIRAAQLTTPQGEPKVGSVRSPHRDGVADSLSPARLGAIMRAADSGDLLQYLTLAEEIEERDPHYRSVLHTRKMAVSGIRPRIELPNDSPDMKKIGDAVERRLVKTPRYEGLIYDLLDGLAKGFSCVEQIWKHDPTEWYPTEFRFREPRHFVFDRDTMTTPRLVSDRVLADWQENGEPLDPFKWIIHKPKLASGIPIRTGLARTIAVCYAAKKWTAADWLAFLDVYGMPMRLGKFPANLADKKSGLLKAVRALGSDAAAVIPQEMEVEFIEANTSGGGTAFREAIEYWDKQTSKCVLGQTMSTDDGSSLSQAKVHEQVRFDIRDADSRAVASTFDEYVIKPYVILNYGEQETYPSLILAQRKPEDSVALMQATKEYVLLGGKVQSSEVRDRLGYDEPEDDADLLKAPAPKPAAPPPGQQPGNRGTSSTKDPATDGDRVEQEGRDVELNQELSPSPADDEIDALLREELGDWKELLNGSVGELLARIQEAGSFEEARALLEQLVRDQGQVLDIGALVVSLARATTKVRGLGDVTDQPRR